MSMMMLGLVTLAASCQIMPGQYRVYRIANEETDSSGGCFPSTPGVDITGDSTTVRAGQTFAVYAADAETYFLDFEGFSLAGVRDGGDYSFTGEIVDVMLLGPMQDSTQTVTTVYDVDLTIAGKKITGSTVEEVRSECSGGMSCPNPASMVCTRTTEFQGAEIKGVELEHGV